MSATRPNVIDNRGDFLHSALSVTAEPADPVGLSPNRLFAADLRASEMFARLWRRIPHSSGLVKVGLGTPCSSPLVAYSLESVARAERERDALAIANERLRDENIQLRAMDIAFRDLLNIADERSHGQLRILVEQAGEQLADWLLEAMDHDT